MESKFTDKVFEACKLIPEGKVTTYKILAQHIGSSPRAVGQALKKNNDSPRIPCHRVVKSDGSIGGFFGDKGGKDLLLENEGIKIIDGFITNFKSVLFTFSKELEIIFED